MKTLTALLSMSIFTVVTLVLVITTVADADVHVRGYYRRNGTYVQPHYRSDPDGNRGNNWSTYPNVNPHTGVRGTRRLSSEDFSNISLQNKPTNLPVYPSAIPGFDSSLYKPSPLPYNPSKDFGRIPLLEN
jgi:hypothetical protein